MRGLDHWIEEGPWGAGNAGPPEGDRPLCEDCEDAGLVELDENGKYVGPGRKDGDDAGLAPGHRFCFCPYCNADE